MLSCSLILYLAYILHSLPISSPFPLRFLFYSSPAPSLSFPPYVLLHSSPSPLFHSSISYFIPSPCSISFPFHNSPSCTSFLFISDFIPSPPPISSPLNLVVHSLFIILHLVLHSSSSPYFTLLYLLFHSFISCFIPFPYPHVQFLLHLLFHSSRSPISLPLHLLFNSFPPPPISFPLHLLYLLNFLLFFTFFLLIFHLISYFILYLNAFAAPFLPPPHLLNFSLSFNPFSSPNATVIFPSSPSPFLHPFLLGIHLLVVTFIISSSNFSAPSFLAPCSHFQVPSSCLSSYFLPLISSSYSASFSYSLTFTRFCSLLLFSSIFSSYSAPFPNS